MASTQITDEFRQAIKEAVAEAIEGQADFLRAIVEDVIEDIALGRAMDDVAGAPEVSRADVLIVLETKL
ncbi:MAG: hypothetical protein HUU46_19655 [Candidatus Hydrogenedentes bacterium]|nr:hypothetical protein [Candidatus Hydrogenedentota bacterium]